VLLAHASVDARVFRPQLSLNQILTIALFRLIG
jgi:hypothetical protein